MKLLILVCFLVTVPSIFGFIKEQSLSFWKDDTCESIFNKFKEDQDYLYAERNGNSFSLGGEIMPGFSVICDKKAHEAKAYLFSKTTDLDSEQEFFLSFLLEKINKKDKELVALSQANESLDKKNNNIHQKKRSQSEESLTLNKDNNSKLENNNLRRSKSWTNTKILNQPKAKKGTFEYEQNIYQSINYEIFIYVKKSPCAVCLNMYNNIINSFPNIRIKAFYSSFFYFRNANIINEPHLSSLFVTKRCNQKVIATNNFKNNRLHRKNNYFAKQMNNKEILDCINYETISSLKNNNFGERLFFKQIEVKPMNLQRVSFLKKSMGLENGIN